MAVSTGAATVWKATRQNRNISFINSMRQPLPLAGIGANGCSVCCCFCCVGAGIGSGIVRGEINKKRTRKHKLGFKEALIYSNLV